MKNCYPQMTQINADEEQGIYTLNGEECYFCTDKKERSCPFTV